MSNSYYNHGSYPTTGAPGASSALRAELDLITVGFALLPTLSGNANKALVINAGGSAVTVTTGTLALAGNFATTGAFNTTLVQGATTSLTLPVVSGTLATLAGTETLSNKTLVAPALGTPASGIMTNVTGTAAGLTAGNVTINANLTGDVTSVGNATSIAAGVIVNADINASAAIDDTKLATIATALKVSNSATTAASANTASAIVSRDASGDFSAGTVTAALTGNASTATALATGRTIAITGDLAYTSPSFDGTGNVTAAGTLATVATAGTTGSSTAIPVITINVKGLTTSITTAVVVAPAGTLTGSTLASGVTASSLTSLGTIASLVVTAGTISTTPSAATDIANKSYVDSIAQGLDTKASVVAGTTANITLSGAQTIDGISIVATDRVLVKNQTAPAENGIYVASATAWTRATDMNTWVQVPGAYVFVETGTTLADTGWVCTSDAGGTLNTTAITWAQFSGAGSGVSSITFGSTGLTPSTTTTGAVTVAGTLAVANGGTGLTAGTSGGVLAYTATGTLASSAALTQYGVVYGGGAGAVPVATAAGTTGQVLTATTSGAPSWAAPATSGTVTSVAMTVPSVLSISGSPITSSGTLALTYSGTALPVANGGTGITSFGTGVATALGVNTGSAGAFVVNGGALGSPSSAGTMPAFTLGGTVSGGGNQINNVVIGTTTPLAGAFTTVSATNPSESLTLRSGNTTRSYLTIGRTAYEAGIGVAGSNLLLGTGDVAGDLDIFTNTATGKINFSAGNTGSIHASLSTTGLAVTGTLSATGIITSTVTSGQVLKAEAGTTGILYNNFINTGGTFLYGIDNSAGTAIFSGSSAYAGFIGTTTATSLVLATNSVARGVFSSTGLAVTGTLSATGAITSAPTSGDASVVVRGFAGSSSFFQLTEAAVADRWTIGVAGSSDTLQFRSGSFSMSTGTQRMTLTAAGTLSGGTSGTAYSFSGSAPATSLTLDSSGNLGIGTNSPTQKLTVLSTSGTYGTEYQPIMQIGNSSSGGTLTATGLGAIVWSTDGTLTPVASIEAVRESPGSGAASALYFRTGSSGGGTTRAVIDSSGNLTISNGNLIVGTAGKGIDFSATASGSGTMTSELLADYEEGTWTPSLGGNTTYSTQAGTYTKIGRQVTVIATVAVSVLGTGSTTTISGLPFSTNATSISGNAVAKFTNLAVNVIGLNVLALDGTVSTLRFANITAAGATNTLDPAIFGNNAGVSFSVTYFVN